MQRIIRLRTFSLIFLVFFLIGVASALTPDSTTTFGSNNPWPVANGSDTAILTVRAMNESIPIPGLSVIFNLENSDVGYLSSTVSETGTDGRASTTFHTKTKSGSTVVNATIIYSVKNVTETLTKQITQNIDHDVPYQISSYNFANEMTVGIAQPFIINFSDQHGNPIDNRNKIEQVQLYVSSADPDNSAFIYANNTSKIITVDLDQYGATPVQMIPNTIVGSNLIWVHPLMQKVDGEQAVPDTTLYIDGVSYGDPWSIQQDFTPNGTAESFPKQYVSKGGENYVFSIVYTLKDQYGNGVANKSVYVATSTPGEEKTVYTNSIGQAMITYGPKSTITFSDYYINASTDNSSVHCEQQIAFVVREASDMVLTASPQSMASWDVGQGRTPPENVSADIIAKVIDPIGNPVENETVDFTILPGSIWYDDPVNYTITRNPELTSLTQTSNTDGYAIVQFHPGAFLSDQSNVTHFNPTSTGHCTVRGTWKGVSHDIELTWKNYPYISLTTSTDKSIVNVTGYVDVTIQLIGDGWALQGNPIDVVLCTDRSGSMLEEVPDRMVAAINAGKIFNSQMKANRDRVGLVSFGDNYATNGWANLTPTYRYLKGNYYCYKAGSGWSTRYLNNYYYDWSNVYGNFKWVYNDDLYDMTDPTTQSYWPYVSSYSISSDYNNYILNHYKGNPRNYGTTNYASVEQVLDWDHSSVNNSIDNMVPAGGTPMREGLYRSVKMIRDNPRTNAVKAIILLSDGAWNTGGDPEGEDDAFSASGLAETDSVITWANQSGIKIYTIGLGTGANAEELESYAEQTGGKYYSTTTGSGLEQIYTDIAGELRTEAGVGTEVDLKFDQLEVNYQTVPMNDTDPILKYVYVPGYSTWIRSWNSTMDIIPAHTVNQTHDWVANKSLTFDQSMVGTIRIGQVWEAHFRMQVLKGGNINIFGPGSQITFQNGPIGGNFNLTLPKTYITGVENMSVSGITSSNLAISNLTDTSPYSSDSGEQLPPIVIWEWDRYYSGSMNVNEQIFVITADGKPNLLASNVISKEQANEHGKFQIARSNLPDNWVEFKVVLTAIDSNSPAIARVSRHAEPQRSQRVYIKIT